MKLADAEDAQEGKQDDTSEAWSIFQKQFPKAAENEIYMTTPCREASKLWMYAFLSHFWPRPKGERHVIHLKDGGRSCYCGT